MEDKNFRGHAAMLAAVIIFGLLAPVSKALLGTAVMNAYTLTLMRMGGACIVFWIASLCIKKEHIPPRDLLQLFFASLLGIVLNQGAFLLGVSKTSPIDASVVTTTTPIFVMLIAAFYLREPITGRKILGIVVGAIGALVLILSSAHLVVGENASSVTGTLLCLGSQLSFATYFVYFKKLIGRYASVTLMKWMFLFATLCCLPFGTADLQAVEWEAIQSTQWLQLAYIVLGATFIAYLLMPIGQKNLRPTVASSYNYVQPLVATLAAVLTGMDRFNLTKGIAIVLVFAGVYIVTRSKSKAQMDAEATAKSRTTTE